MIDADPASGSRPRRVDVTFVGHATTRIEVAGLRVLTDPFLRRSLGPLERHGPSPGEWVTERIDVVLITHGHPDHLDPPSLATIGPGALFVVPRGLGRWVRSVTGAPVVELEAGQTIAPRGVPVRAVPARHWISPGAPRAEPIGFVVGDGARVYVAGDTADMPGLVESVGLVDLAIVPVWTWGPHLGPGHLGPRSAADLVARLGARAAVPVHWGTLYPRRLHRLWGRPLREPGPRFAEHLAELAPGCDVRVLAPGDSTRFDL